MAPFCVNCNLEMRCTKTGITLHFGGGHCYRGDKFQCGCGTEIVTGFNGSYYCPEIKNMESSNELIHVKE